MQGQLEPHFFNFARSVPSSEFIDDLQLTAEQRKTDKADIFFENRQIIAEVKLLETDMAPKIDPILAPYRDTKEWPVFYGSRPLSKVLEHLRDGEVLRRKIYQAITNRLEKIVADANRQIRESKASFALPDSRGLLVVLNDTIDILDPNVMAHRVAQALLKKTPTGKPRFQEVGAAWLLCETHMIPVPGMRGGLLSVVMSNPSVPEDPHLESFVDQLQQRWAVFNRVPMLRAAMNSQDLNTVPLHSAKAAAEPDRITRSELWRREYRANPDLRSMTKDELLDYGEEVMDDAARQFSVGAPKPTTEQTEKLGRESTAFLEEIAARNMDMRELTRHIEKKRGG